MPRLLDRQIALLAHLTSPAAIFGTGRGRIDARLAGLDRSRLQLEARFSHEKRMDKIRRVFAKTFELLGAGAPRLVRQFAAACPPTDIGRLHNARQFHDFLRRRTRRRPGRRPYLADVAACELALAEARSFAEDNVTPLSPRPAGRPGWIRRRPGVVLLRCRYDIRPIFEGRAGRVIKRRLHLAIAVPPGADAPQVFELTTPVFELVQSLDGPGEDVEIDPAGETGALFAALTAQGLVEARR